jgi:hypothetical protein
LYITSCGSWIGVNSQVLCHQKRRWEGREEGVVGIKAERMRRRGEERRAKPQQRNLPVLTRR